MRAYIALATFFVLPFLLIALLVFIVRRRKKREAQGIYDHVDNFDDLAHGAFNFKRNIVAASIAVTLGLVFCLEILSSRSLNISFPALFAMGAANDVLVRQQGEWYRLFTAPFLHAGILHIICNLSALIWASEVLEARIGRMWFLAIYFCGLLGGSLLSVGLGDSFSVGASGAIMGLFSAIVMVGFRIVDKSRRKSFLKFSLRVLIPPLLPIFSFIDYGAHLGGAIAGAACAGFMLHCWPKGEARPKLSRAAYAVAVAGIMIAVLSVFLAALNYGNSKLIGECLLSSFKKEGLPLEDYIEICRMLGNK